MNLIQLTHPQFGRRVGVIEEPNIILIDKTITTTYDLFTGLINRTILTSIESLKTNEIIHYDEVYYSRDKWRILAPVDSPDPMQCMLSGTGLTHKASADNRQKMHESQKDSQLTDSMKMYLLGEEGGKPAANTIGVQPEWFYKGNGFNLKGYRDPLLVPNYANDGGEEPEIAGVYLVSDEGIPYRLGLTQANEFSDHVMEKKNYLYLAPSKMRTCSIGPELNLNIDINSFPGTVSIIREGKTFWSKSILSGEIAMAHSYANLEHHHFKYEQNRIPGQLHIHFFGAGAFSFGEGVLLKQGDEMSISFENMGRPLINSVHIDSNREEFIEIRSLTERM